MNSKKISFKAAAKKLLAQTGEPMTPKEITALAMDEGLIITLGLWFQIYGLRVKDVLS